MIVINYGLYDFFGEVDYAAVTAKSSTALGIIKDDYDSIKNKSRRDSFLIWVCS